MIKTSNNYRSIKFLHHEYATFRPNVCKYFIEEVLPNSHNILDPMSGTAPLIPYIEYLNLTAFFYDILPIYYFINKAKTYEVFKKVYKNRLATIEKELITCLKPLKNKKLVISRKWIPDDILEVLLDVWNLSDNYEKQINIFFKAIIILSIRSLSCTTVTPKNSTWYKPGGMTSEKDINQIVHENINKYGIYYDTYYNKLELSKGGKIRFNTCKAQLIQNLKNIDTIITSPPYPNRYDYVTMYRPELYFLSKVDSNINIETLRTEILASNKVIDFKLINNDIEIINKKSPKTMNFLLAVKGKGKEDENNYYFRCFMKYFTQLYNILDNLIDILIEKGRLFIVIQNNIHRGELNSMDDFVIDYFKHKGLEPNIVHQELHKHQGTRNISADYPLVLKKHKECIIEVVK